MKRKSETPAMARRIAFAQGVVICPWCGKRIKAKDEVIREHIQPLALDGSDIEDNMAYLHKACAQEKTTGRKHMSDGDNQKITKAARLERGGKKSRHPMQKTGQKIQSRPFKSDWQPNTKQIDEPLPEMGDPNVND